LVTYAEISSDDGNDIDSTPDTITMNDAYSSVTENSLTATEDDHDPEVLDIIRRGTLGGVVYFDSGANGIYNGTDRGIP